MFEEVYNSIKNHKTRSFLTGFGITWGILILIVLVGIGKGFEEGVMKLFNGFAKKTIYIISGQTSKPYMAYPIGRKIYFSLKDISDIKRIIPDIKDISGEATQNFSIYNEDRIFRFDVKGVSAPYFNIKLLNLSYGRVINSFDFMQNRKVALIGEDVAKYLFNKKNVIGKSVNIGGVFFTIIGVIQNSLFNTFESRLVYIPYSTYSNYFNKRDQISLVILAISDGVDTKKIEKRIKSLMGERDNFSSTDEKVFFFNSLDEQLKAFSSLFTALRNFLWFMGLSTLFSGIIGVANIMFSVAKERTREIGIRKAVGAKNKEVMKMFIVEAVILTSVAGYIGIMIGALILKIISYFIETSNKNILFEKPSINLSITLAATLILIISGTMAGFIPAVFASKLNPVDALRQE